MQAIDVELRFKGERDYLHGTDVYEAAVACLRRQWPSLDGRCRYTFHRLARRPLVATFSRFDPVGMARRPESVAEMHVTGGSVEASIWFAERDGTIAGRYPYDEDGVVRGCTIVGRRISPGVPSAALPIELAVAMTKKLHNALMKPEPGRWLFTRIDLKRLLRPEDSSGMSVTLAGTPRTAISRSEIAVGADPLGSIYFSVGQP